MPKLLTTLLATVWLFTLQANADTTQSPAISQITVASEEWQNATHKDGTGLYWDIFRYVYEPIGIKVKFISAPYEKAVGYVKRGQADAWPASYENEKPFALYPHWNFDSETVTVMYCTDHQTKFDDINSLTNKEVAWIEGYDYHLYIDVPMNITEANNRKSILRMLKKGRVDFFLDAEIDMGFAKQEHYPEDSALVIQDIMKLKLYPAFANTPKGRALMELWDQRMQKIYNTTKMKGLFKQWGFEYPFAESENQ